jgi:hypothetical protein
LGTACAGHEQQAAERQRVGGDDLPPANVNSTGNGLNYGIEQPLYFKK